MNDYEKYSLLINSLGIFATLIIIIIAIWGERIRQKWNTPKLQLDLIEPTTNVTGHGRNGWYYLIQVKNNRKSVPAKNTRILLNKIYKKAPDGTWKEKEFSAPTQVMWQWPNISPLYATIGPPEIATFGALLEESYSIALKMYWYPNNLDRQILPNDPTRLDFKAVSDTNESNNLIVEISWDGEWNAGRLEMKTHCVVKQVA